MNLFKRIIFIILIIFFILLITILVSFKLLKVKTTNILNDYSSIYNNEKYKDAYLINNIDVFKQDISCGYAVIEMFAKWSNINITEKTLYKEYGRVVTSTGKSFENEMNKQFKDYKTTMYKYLKNTELIDKIYNSLSNGIPVPFEWAAKLDDVWTLHYSLVIGLDIPNDVITIANPYGYIEKITIKEFINRTSFESYDNMPLFLKLGFAFNIFEKNTIFIIEKKLNENNKDEVNHTMKITINNKEYNINLEDNDTVKSLIKILPIEIAMSELNGNEKYFYLNNNLPTNSINPKYITKGDVMLYGNNCLVIFYKSFETPYSYTKIGHIDNLDDLGSGSIKVKIDN